MKPLPHAIKRAENVPTPTPKCFTFVQVKRNKNKPVKHFFMLYSITPNNLHIFNSYNYRKEEMLYVLFKTYCRNLNSKVWTREFDSLENEWCVHNALYRLHILRSRTADVDLNYPCRAEWLYNLLAPIARIIIK